MKLSILATLALAVGAMAGKQKIPNNQPCKQDGTMGECQSGFCMAQGNQVGKCKPAN